MWQVLIKGSLQVCLLDIENLNLKQYTSIPVYLKKFASEAVVCLCTYSVFSSFREGFEEKKGKGKEKGGASLPSGGGGAAAAKAKRDKGITSWGFENTALEDRILGGKVSSRTLFICPECGMKANGGNIARHQKASGHTGDKIKVHKEPKQA